MLVTFISECEKNSLKRTRRVLDTFANRIGNNTWQTPITDEGLEAVQKLLKKTASKNTAVSCHQLKSRIRTELLWVVGNRDKFNNEGIVAVNYTEKDTDQFIDKSNWKSIEVIKYAGAIAGLFHDFGKANILFQNKLNKNYKGAKFEPYRHEWVSLRLFQAFVGDKTDKEWLEALSQIENNDFPKYFKDGIDGSVSDNQPITTLPSLAKLVAWLILTHHRLPLYPEWKEKSPPDLKHTDDWLNKNFAANWDSYNCKDDAQQDRVEKNWQCDSLPTNSIKWRSHSITIVSRAITKLKQWVEQDINWLNDELFTTHLTRLCLILADHHYSSLDQPTEEWRGINYQVWANTDRKTKNHKQKLDEHLIGVAYNTKAIATALPKLNGSLRSLKTLKNLNDNVGKEFKGKFGWQDAAKKLAKKLGKQTKEQGFFGVNMASTGTGKTLANAKIMTAIGAEIGRIRFSVALGLRTLTLQTGKEYRKELKLNDEELAIMVGGIAVKQLFENEQNKKDTGSESENDYLSDFKMDYKGELYEHSLSLWTKKKEPLEKLIQAPLLVSTIDHLIPATDGVKGDKHIPATLRLLTSDLVLDEPDDFGLDDLPALCRLVNWAGMLGSRVLLSTATMPPALVYALFQAYEKGWGQYAKANIANWNGEVVCAWFDEFNTQTAQHKESNEFKKQHENFVKKYIKALNKTAKIKHKGDILNIIESDKSPIKRLAQTIHNSIDDLHSRHRIIKNNKNISIGLVRMANIKPLVAVAKELRTMDAPENTCIHYCIYHSCYPLAIRSYIENKLDWILNRKEKLNDVDKDKRSTIWKKYISNKILNSDCKNHIFVVIASPVAEVGRDHDYDWAIVEPSSMRSIIQLAGRVLRHRDKTPDTPNILLLNQNYKNLISKEVCFEYPGFESQEMKMVKHNLDEILSKEQYQNINSIPRTTLPEKYQIQSGQYINLVELEHKALYNRLFSEENGAKLWWRSNPTWCGEMQRQQKFRKSKKDEGYYLIVSDAGYEQWQWKNENVYPAEFGECSIDISSDELEGFGKNSHFWFNLNIADIYQKLSKDLKINSIEEVSERFGEVRLVEYKNSSQEYKYHPNLGLYKIVK